jgi:hypothetical protein
MDFELQLLLTGLPGLGWAQFREEDQQMLQQHHMQVQGFATGLAPLQLPFVDELVPGEGSIVAYFAKKERKTGTQDSHSEVELLEEALLTAGPV